MISPDGYNEHHIVRHGNRKLWEVYPEGRKLVRDPSLISTISIESHEWINQHCPPVPALGYYSLTQTCKWFHEFKPTLDPLEGIENLFESLYRAQEHERAFPEEQALIRLVIGSISKQIPAIRNGLLLP